jgi:hypothetical protein
MTNQVVTTDSNTTPGNAAITGMFSANTFRVGNSSLNATFGAPNTFHISSGDYFLNANGSWSRSSVIGNNGIIANTNGVFVNANTGLVVNTAGLFVNASYIGTITANNATNLGGVVAASYVKNTDSRTMSGNLTFSGTNITFTGALSVATVTSGTWSASTIATDRGGTGQTTYTDGQILIGSTSADSLVKTTLTAANNITVTNGNGSITIASNPNLSYVSSASSGTVRITGGGTDATIPAATASIAGLVTTGTQTIAGVKTFNNGTASSNTITGTVVITGGLGVSGAINAGSDITAYATSDIRLKKNIKAIPDALEKVMQISGVTYNWNDIAHEVENKDMSVNEVGVIAQEINVILPEVITTRDNGYMAVRYEKIVPLLIEAIKELNEQVKSLKSELESK